MHLPGLNHTHDAGSRERGSFSWPCWHKKDLCRARQSTSEMALAGDLNLCRPRQSTSDMMLAGDLSLCRARQSTSETVLAGDLNLSNYRANSPMSDMLFAGGLKLYREKQLGTPFILGTPIEGKLFKFLNPSHHTTFLNMKDRKRGSN